MDETSDELGDRLLEQAIELWIRPELERRRAEGAIDDTFVLSAAQIVMSVDGLAPQVRLNDEVRAVADVKIRTEKAVEKGDPILEQDVDAIEGIRLTDADPNEGHLTIIRLGDRWVMGFDFRYNAARIAHHLSVAEEFLDAAATALERRHLSAFVENLFASTELMAKSILLMLPDERFLTSKKHGFITARFNQWGKLGNTDPRFVRLLNRLWELRDAARYMRTPLRINAGDAQELLSTAREMFASASNAAPTRFQVSENDRR